MKMMRNTSAFVLLLAMLMALVLPAAALAEEPAVAFSESKVIVFAPGEGCGSLDLFEEFKNVMPGDVLEDTISIENQNTTFDYLKIYIRAIPHDANNAPKADVSAEESNEFLSKLRMKLFNASEMIYDASPDDPDGLAESTFLAQLPSQGKLDLKVELSVPLELDNAYAGRIGEVVDWEFTVEGYDTDVLTAAKLWTGDTANHPASVQVQLLKGGAVADTQTLSEANNWTYTWSNLDQDEAWDVQEVAVDGYTTTYTWEGNTVFITNHKPGDTPSVPARDLTVVKRWDNKAEAHPEEVTITLYDGSTAVERVVLNDANHWTHTWHNLKGECQWRVLETNIDGGYVPWYSTKGDVVTVTNAKRLIQTGQLSWPIPVLGGLGLLLILFGLYILIKRRKETHAQ